MATLRNRKKTCSTKQGKLWGTFYEQLGTKLKCSHTRGRLHHSGFRKDWGRVTRKLSQKFSRKKNRIIGALSRVEHFLMNMLIHGYSGNVPETTFDAFSTTQGTRRRLPEWSSSWMRHPTESDDTKLWLTRWPWHRDRSPRRSHILLPQYIFRQAEKKSLYQSTETPKWKHSCDDRGRPILLALQQLAKKQQFNNFSWQQNWIFQVAKVGHHNDAHVLREIR